jgi:hypothetical protein
MYIHHNPWPNGHEISDLSLTARLERNSGIWLDLHLETDPYYAEPAEKKPKKKEEVKEAGSNDDKAHATENADSASEHNGDEDAEAEPDEDDEDDSKNEDNNDDDGDDDDCFWGGGVASWGNYHQCTVSSTRWAGQGVGKGLLAGTADAPLDLFKKEGQLVEADRLTWFGSERGRAAASACGTYLLGHDSVADHRIRLSLCPAGEAGGSSVAPSDDPVWTLDWRGRFALTYVGNKSYDGSFELSYSGLALDSGIQMPDDCSSEAEAKELLGRYVKHPEAYTIVSIDGTYAALPFK